MEKDKYEFNLIQRRNLRSIQVFVIRCWVSMTTNLQLTCTQMSLKGNTLLEIGNGIMKAER